MVAGLGVPIFRVFTVNKNLAEHYDVTPFLHLHIQIFPLCRYIFGQNPFKTS